MSAIAHGGNVFAIARERGWDWRELLDFSASINPLGPAPGVRDAIVEAIDRVIHYPERHGAQLTRALAEAWNIEPECILVGNGATDLIHFTARAWPQPDVTLVVPTFTEFHRAYPDAAWAPADSPESWPEEGLLILTRPNNPVGFDMPVPDGRIGPTMIDESFIDFTDRKPSSGTADIVLRSLTKIYALPGLRVGAVVGPPALIARWREQRDPWALNVLAEAAALASIADHDHLVKTREYITQERSHSLEMVDRLPGVAPLPGCANFLFAKLNYPAAALCEYMQNNKVLLRNCTGWIGIEGEAVRFAIRTREDNERLVELWRNFQCES